MKLRYVLGGAAVYGLGVYVGVLAYRASRGGEQRHQTREDCDEARRRATFGSLARTYDEKIGFSERLAGIGSMRKRLLSQAKGEILEIAAGTGRNLTYYPDNASVVVTDFSQEMLQVAQAEAARLKGKTLNAQFRVADGKALPYPSNSFDTVVDTFGICSFEDPEKVLEEMSRVCKPDGRILLLEHGRSKHGYSWLNSYLDNRALDHAFDWGCWWNKDIRAILNQAGLEVERETYHHFGTTYELVCKPNK